MIQDNILDVFELFRMAPTPKDQYQQTGRALLREKITPFINDLNPIEFVMLGFPFKSTNTRDKVLGIKPDLGEELTLKTFSQFNDMVSVFYPPGIRMNVVSDGFVFNDILHTDDKVVEEYKEISMDMGRDVRWFDLRDFYGKSLKTGREKLTEQFGITPDKLQQDILFNDDVNMLYKGMTRFMMEELVINNYPSTNQLQKAAKILTREMMFRNEAYSNLVKEEFKDYVRLSMHPSINSGAKYSFQLIPGGTHSAWHCVIVVDNNKHITMHRKDAETAGYRIETRNNQPYNYTTWK